MGNAESGNPVRNMDKRTARREYKADFSAAITRYRQRMGHYLPNQSVTGGGSDIIWDNSGNVKVFVRKRPIFQHEIDSSEFDVITCFPDKVVVHDARMHNDMKRQLINHHEFTFDKVFHEKTSNEVVYEQAARPLVNIAVNGGYSTALVYGQTGSGKTFTMSSIYKQAAQDIFSMLHDQMGRFAEPPVVSLSFIEIAGDSVSDLLNGFHPTQLTSASDGSVHAYPVVEPVVSDTDELLAVIQHGLNIRTTAATGVHDSSSRSHAMLRIFINRTDISDSGETIEGTLTLVDLAGSEHRIDSMYHGKERRKETSYINASLMALKDCIRSRAAQFAAAAADGQKVPNLTANAHIYRKSKLTMALKNSFVLPHARTIVIATVSPASKDTEHSLNTLRHACLMNGQDTNPEETRFITGGTTTTEQIGEINISNIARRNQLLKRQQGSIEEAKTSNGNTLDNRVAKAANQEVELTEKMKLKMRRMSENRSFAALDPRIKDIFKAFRQKLGREQRQMRRMRVNRFEEMETVLQKLAQDEAEARRKLGIREGDDEEGEDDNDDDGGRGAGDDGTIDDHVDGFHSSRKDEEIAEELHMPPPSARELSTRKARGHHHQQPQQQQPSSSPLSQMHEYADDFEEPVVSGRRPSSGKATTATTASPRVPFQQIYDAIYIARDEVPERILQKQLRAMLKLHHYADVEVQAFLSGMTASSATAAAAAGTKATGTVSSNRIASSTASSSRPATPTNRRISSGSGGGSGGSVGATTATVQHTPTGTTTTPHRSRPVGSLALGYANATRESVSESGLKPSLSAPSLPGGAAGGSGTGTGSGALGTKDVSSIIKGTIKRAATPTRRVTSSALDMEDQSSSLSLAKQKVEEEARVKKQRQEQARFHREEQERLKAEKVLQKKGAGSGGGGGGGRSSSKLLMKTAEEAANDAERDRHAEEAAKLTAALEEDQAARPEDKLSAAMKFGIKKQLSIHKAAILRLERAKLALQNGVSTGGVVGGAAAAGAAVGAGAGAGAGLGAARPSNPFDDMPLPTTKKTASTAVNYDDGAAAASAYEPPPAGALAHLKKKSTSSSSSSSTAAAKQRLAGARGVSKTRGAFEYDPADFGHVDDDDDHASAAVAQTPPPVANEDTFYDHRPVGGSRAIAAAHGYDSRAAAAAAAVNHNRHNDYADDGGVDEYMISETGRPIGKHMAQHILHQHRPPSNSSSTAAARSTGNSQGPPYGSSIGGRSTGGSTGSGGGSGVIGYHIEDRSSYDSDTFSRAMHQPVGLRSDHYFAANSHGNSNGGSSQQSSTRGYPASSQAPPQHQPYDEYFQESREDFTRRPTSSSFQPQQQPLSARGNSNLRGGGRR